MRKILLIGFLFIFYYVGTNAYNYLNVLNQHMSQQEQGLSIQSEDTYTPSKEPVLSQQYMFDSIEEADLDTILNKYDLKFNELEEEMLNEISNIRDEILSMFDEGANPLALGMNLLKYERIATELEEKADQQFETLYDNLVFELTENGFESDEARSFKNRYNRAKRQIKNDLIQEANAWLSGSESF